MTYLNICIVLRILVKSVFMNVPVFHKDVLFVTDLDAHFDNKCIFGDARSNNYMYYILQTCIKNIKEPIK